MSREPAPITDLITGFWGEQVVALTEKVWTWMPSLAVVSVTQLGQPMVDIERQLRAAGYVRVTKESLATVCQFLGMGVLLLVDHRTPQREVVWATQETAAFAAHHPLILGFPPLLGGESAEAWSLPPYAYGTLALRVSPDGEAQPLRAAHLTPAGVDALRGLRLLLEQLLRMRERPQNAPVMEAVFVLFMSQLATVLTAYGEERVPVRRQHAALGALVHRTVGARRRRRCVSVGRLPWEQEG